MPKRYPALLAQPKAAEGRLWLTNVRLFDGTGAPVREAAAVLVEDGRVARVGDASEAAPEGARTIDADGRTLRPGLVDAHAHVAGRVPPPEHGSEPVYENTRAHFLNTSLREVLRHGITTMRDVGSFDDQVVEARQAMRYGAFRGPRLLTCGRIVSATSPGGKFFDGMYREADGEDEVRKAVREQLRKGADFIKIMTTGARSVELEDPGPAQMTRAEMGALVEEAHRMGYRVAAHCEGLEGTEVAIEVGVDTIEHGMYLNQRLDLLERMAAADQVLVPTFSCFYGVAGLGNRVDPGGEVVAPEVPVATWTGLLADLADYNLEQAGKTLGAAKAAGVRIAMGHDWGPLWNGSIEILRMIHHGLTPAEALVASTAGGAYALGLTEFVGTIEPGKLADLLLVDGDPLAEPSLLHDRGRIWLVLQLGEPVAGAALEVEPSRLEAASLATA